MKNKSGMPSGEGLKKNGIEDGTELTASLKELSAEAQRVANLNLENNPNLLEKTKTFLGKYCNYLLLAGGIILIKIGSDFIEYQGGNPANNLVLSVETVKGLILAVPATIATIVATVGLIGTDETPVNHNR